MKLVRWLSCCAALAATAMMVAGNVFAQKYPDRPLRLVVPYAPGGSVDILGRLIAGKLSETLGQQVVVDNRGGGGATIGTGIVAKAPPDGYTLLLADIAFGANPALMSKLPYDSARDFVPVGLVAKLPSILVVTPTLPANTVKDLIADAKASPGKLNYSSAGVGSMNYLAGELFKANYGLDIVHVPYQSGGQAIAAILGGQTQLVITTIPPVLQHVKGGKVKALAVWASGDRACFPTCRRSKRPVSGTSTCRCGRACWRLRARRPISWRGSTPISTRSSRCPT